MGKTGRNRHSWIRISVWLVIGGLGLTVWHLMRREPAQVVQLPNGLTLRLAAVTYGTNHVVGSPLARVVSKLPLLAGNLARRLLGPRLCQLNTRATDHASLCFWFEPRLSDSVPLTEALSMPITLPDGQKPVLRGNAVSPLSLQAVLADAHGVIGGKREQVSVWLGVGPPQLLHSAFAAVPRRSQWLECCLSEIKWDGQYRDVGRVRIRNPLYGRFPQWQPEPLPIVKQAGDVAVHLERFSTERSGDSETTGQPQGKGVTRFAPTGPGHEMRAAFDLSIDSPRGSNEIWTVLGAELSDATGNHMLATGCSERGAGHYAIEPVLWPDETAWRLKLELRRETGFSSEELVIFTNVAVPPIGRTNVLAMARNVGGIDFVLRQINRKPDLSGSSWLSSDASCVRIEHGRILEGLHFCFLEAHVEDGAKLEVFSQSRKETSCDIYFKSIPAGANRVVLIFALQRTQPVEFLVKPDRPADNSL